MQYPWPIVYSDAVLQEAIEIALGYLELTGQAFAYSEIQQVCAHYHHGAGAQSTVLSWRMTPSLLLKKTGFSTARNAIVLSEGFLRCAEAISVKV